MGLIGAVPAESVVRLRFCTALSPDRALLSRVQPDFRPHPTALPRSEQAVGMAFVMVLGLFEGSAELPLL